MQEHPYSSMVLSITQCKPNPVGRDRLGTDIPNSQLAGEWLDVKNLGTVSADLSEIVINHIAYTQEHPEGEWRFMIGFGFALPAGSIVRVHAGGKVDLSYLNKVDVIGADYHVFTGKGYSLNNYKDDKIGIWHPTRKVWIDIAKYKAYPPEGKVLRRNGDYLI